MHLFIRDILYITTFVLNLATYQKQLSHFIKIIINNKMKMAFLMIMLNNFFFQIDLYIVYDLPTILTTNLIIYPLNISNYRMSSVKCPILKGQKRVFFHRFLTQISSSNHYMLWWKLIISYQNHNTSSELYSQSQNVPNQSSLSLAFLDIPDMRRTSASSARDSKAVPYFTSSVTASTCLERSIKMS